MKIAKSLGKNLLKPTLGPFLGLGGDKAVAKTPASNRYPSHNLRLIKDHTLAPLLELLTADDRSAALPSTGAISMTCG